MTLFSVHLDHRDNTLLQIPQVAGRSSRGYITANRYDPKGKEEDTRLSRQQILDACDASLKRLQTNYLDLYQLHWPDR